MTTTKIQQSTVEVEQSKHNGTRFFWIHSREGVVWCGMRNGCGVVW